MKVFARKFSEGGLEITGLPGGAIWHERLLIWGHFSATEHRAPPERYWNLFGQQPSRLKDNMVVEINPAKEGINPNRQGIVAIDKSGDRWLFHQGRLHPGRVRVTENMFDEVAKSPRFEVSYSDGRIVACHPITNLDGTAQSVQNDVAKFVDLCARVRFRFTAGAADAELLARVSSAEGSEGPELRGSYDLPEQAARIAQRRHGEVYHALAAALKRMQIPHSRARFGRWGPDLFVNSTRGWFLFELKADCRASDIQQALGQLQLYEFLGRRKFTKVMVLPSDPPADIGRALKAFKITVLRFGYHGRKVEIDDVELKRIMATYSRE